MESAVAALAALLVFGAAAAAGEPIAGESTAAESTAAESIHDERLPNGARLITQSRPGCGTFAIQLTARGGRAEDPADRAGLTDLLARLLLRGTATRTAGQQALEVERLGATLDSWGGVLGVTLRATGPAPALATALDVLGDAAAHPRLEPADLSKEVSLARQSLQRSLDVPSTARERAALPLIFGDHPLGRVADPATWMSGLDAGMVRGAHAARFTGQRLILVVTGDFDPEAIRRQALASIGALPAGDPPPGPLPRPAPLAAPRRMRVHRRTAQPELELALPTDGAAEADELAMDLLAHILGGFEERLSTEIREKRGWAYWLAVLDWRYPGAGAFGVVTAVPRRHLQETERIIGEQLRRLAADPPAAGEVDRARRYLLTALARASQQAAGRAGLISSAAVRGRPLRSYEQTAAAYAAVTPEAIRDVAARLLGGSAMAAITLY